MQNSLELFWIPSPGKKGKIGNWTHWKCKLGCVCFPWEVATLSRWQIMLEKLRLTLYRLETSHHPQNNCLLDILLTVCYRSIKLTSQNSELVILVKKYYLRNEKYYIFSLRLVLVELILLGSYLLWFHFNKFVIWRTIYVFLVKLNCF